MDSQEKSSPEAQTTKVADPTSPTSPKQNTETTMADVKEEQSTLNPEAPVKSEHTLSPVTKDNSNETMKHSASLRVQPRSSRSPEQKRRAPRSPSPFTKRQRTSQSPSTSRNHEYPTSSRPEPAAPRPSSRPKLDDKARNRRLFGGMLSTIAAKPNQRAARPPRPVDNSKREELERRAAERERGRLKEEEDARRERELRRREENREKYIAWERDTILAKADNDRIRAEFLETKAKPALYYKPYILTNEQRDTLNRKMDDTEVRIGKDIRKYEEAHPDQRPLPWKPIPPPARKDSMGMDKEGSPQVSKSSPGNNVAMKDEPVSKLDGAKAQSSEQRKDKPKADDFDDDVIETSEGGVSLIY